MAFHIELIAIDRYLLGVRTLEGFGVVVDAIARRLLSTIAIVASGVAT